MICTQRQLESVSDFELSAHLVMMGGLKPCAQQDDTFVRVENLAREKGWAEYDFCNNPNDIIPLCFEEGISLIAPEGHSELWMAIPRGRGDINVSHKNPLRAAAIVYILVMQSKIITPY